MTDQLHVRTLLASDPFCPQCGHNRDTSSASSIDHGTHKSCQMCGATWREAADALEAGRGEPVAWRVRGHAFDFNTDEPRLWHYYTGSRRPTVGVPYRCDIEPLYAAPAAQVAQEGGGVATDGGTEK